MAEGTGAIKRGGRDWLAAVSGESAADKVLGRSGGGGGVSNGGDSGSSDISGGSSGGSSGSGGGDNLLDDSLDNGDERGSGGHRAYVYVTMLREPVERMMSWHAWCHSASADHCNSGEHKA